MTSLEKHENKVNVILNEAMKWQVKNLCWVSLGIFD
jgi:hypothetical protein